MSFFNDLAWIVTFSYLPIAVLPHIMTPSWKSNKCCSTDFVAFGFLLLIYMNPVDCRKILIWLSWDQIERTDDLRAAWDTCLKSSLLHVTGETAALWCFSWIQFIALCQTSKHHFRYWGGKIKNYLNHLPQAQLKSNTSSLCLCSLSFPCFHQELYSAPVISFSKVTGHTGGWAHMHTSFLMLFIS